MSQRLGMTLSDIGTAVSLLLLPPWDMAAQFSFLISHSASLQVSDHSSASPPNFNSRDRGAKLVAPLSEFRWPTTVSLPFRFLIRLGGGGEEWGGTSCPGSSEFRVSTEQVRNECGDYRISTGWVQNKYRIRTEQVRNEYRIRPRNSRETTKKGSPALTASTSFAGE